MHDKASHGGLSEKSTNVDGPPPDGHGSFTPDPNLTQEQVQMFEKGNQDMMTHYQETLDKVRYVPSIPTVSLYTMTNNPIQDG